MIVRGRIVSFNETTWWGRACYDLEVVEFHGTSVHGMTTRDGSLVGRACDLVFNDDGRLFDVRIRDE